MKIKINFREEDWENNITIEDLLTKMREDEKNRYFFTDFVTVILNNEVIHTTEYAQIFLSEGDEVRIYPLIAGG